MIKNTIKMTGMETDQNIKKHVDKILRTLGRYAEAYDDSAIVDIEIAKENNHRSGDIFEVRVNFRAHHIDVSAKALKETPYDALEDVRKELVSALQTQKKKRIHFTRRSALRVKNFFKRLM
jgi:ribosome-associated translation inhibitor RaiA